MNTIKYINETVRLGVRPQLLSTERDRRHTADVVNRCQWSATVATCC